MTRAELLERISARELTAWSVLYGLEPWGERRLDVNTAYLCSFLANLLRGSEEAKPFEPSAFLIDFWRDPDERPKPADPRSIFEFFKAGAVKKGDGKARR